MASPSDSQPVMGYPSVKPNQQLPHPGFAVPGQPTTYPPPSPQTGYHGYMGQSASKNYPPPPPPQPGYHGYAGQSASKNYVSPSFNMWYNSGNYGAMGWAGPEDDDTGKRFGRVMLVTMVILIVSMCMVSLAIWFLFGMEVPEFHVSSLSVSNLNVSDTWIEANWAANITVFNPNSDVKVDFEPIRASIFYKNSPLGMSGAETFYLQGARLHILPINFDNQKALSKPLLSEEMNAERSNGFIFVSLRINLGAKFASNSIWRKESLRVFCEDLKINLAPQGGEGTLAEDAQTECLVFT